MIGRDMARKDGDVGDEQRVKTSSRNRTELPNTAKLLLEAYEQAKRASTNSDGRSGGKGVLFDQFMGLFTARLNARHAERDRQHKKELFPDADTHFVARTSSEWHYDQQHKKLFSEIPHIEGARIVLDRIVDTDAAALTELVSSENVYRFEPTFLFERQYEDQHEAIRNIYGDVFENKDALILAIRMKETGELAGLAEFYSLRDSLHKVSIGYRLLERFWGLGLATEAVKLMVGYLYGETDIELITASTMVANARSAHVLEKCGFIRTAYDAEEDWGYPEPTIVDKWFC